MGTTLRFDVQGVPKPGGSKRGFIIKRKSGKLGISMVDASGAKGKDWRGDVKAAAFAACREGWTIPHPEQPLRLTLMLYMPRPKKHLRSNGQLKPNAPVFHTIRPDATKLLRSIEDALTGIVWNDDGQIASQSVVKSYARVGEAPGCEILVEYLK